jgi:hypothetical protein
MVMAQFKVTESRIPKVLNIKKEQNAQKEAQDQEISHKGREEIEKRRNFGTRDRTHEATLPIFCQMRATSSMIACRSSSSCL